MDISLACYIEAALKDKLDEALRELNHVIDNGFDDEVIKGVALEYVRRKRMINYFIEYLENHKDKE